MIILSFLDAVVQSKNISFSYCVVFLSSSWINSFLWRRALLNTMKLWAMLCRATKDRWVILKSSDQMWSTREGNGNTLQYFWLKNPMWNMKRQKVMTLKDEPHRSECVQYATEQEQRAITNSSWKTEVAGQKQKQQSVVDASGGESKVWYCKENIA